MTSMAINVDQHPRDGRRIMDSKQFRDEVGPVSHIAERRYKLGYYHHYLVTEVSDNSVELIHYGPLYKCFVRVHKKSLTFDEMDFEHGVYLICSEGYPQSTEEKAEAIRRAFSRFGEDLYMAATNNCEHFVTWALTGRSVSYQIEVAKPKQKLFADSFDALVKKTTALNLIVDGSQLPLNKVLKRRTVPGQLASQAMTPTSPAKTSFNMSATELAAMTRTAMPEETFGICGLPWYLFNSSKQMFSDISGVLKLDGTWQSTFQTVQKALADTVDNAYKFDSRKYMTDLNAFRTAFETAQQLIAKAGKEAVQKPVAKSIQAVKIIAGKSAASAAKEVIKQTAKHEAKCAAVTTTIVETIGVGIDIYKLYKNHGKEGISDTNFPRGVCTKIGGAIGSIAGSTIGAYLGYTAGAALGQIFIPIPGIGACVGSMLFGFAGKALFSRAFGFLFDSITK